MPKWTKGLGPDAPARKAGRRMLRARLKSVEKAVLRLRKRRPSHDKKDTERVHALRVATRRGTAAVRALKGILGEKQAKRASKWLKALRHAASAARDCDVHRDALSGMLPGALEDDRPALLHALERLDAERAEADSGLAKALRGESRPSLENRRRRLLERLRSSDDSLTIGRTATETIAELTGAVREVGARDLEEIQNVHLLRIEAKHLRYGVDNLAFCIDAGTRDTLLDHLQTLQDRLGALNDLAQLTTRVERYRDELDPPSGPPGEAATGADRQSAQLRQGLHHLAASLTAQRDQQHGAFLSWWPGWRDHELLPALDAVAPGATPATHAVTLAVPAPVDANSPPDGRPRIAAIDIGSNSIRLIIAEVEPDGAYRVLDDEREVARLARTLHSTGALDTEAMDTAALAVSRMKGIAEGYGVRRLCVVATAAVREATNSAEFVDLIREIAGLPVEVISAEKEAMLSYRSASRAFDLASNPGAVVDIGGGSAQIVLSAARAAAQASGSAPEPGAGGVVERVYMLPMGAVRLTERFGGADRAAGRRFEEMRAAVKKQVRRAVGQPPLVPQTVVGTGGTFTTLAAICAHAEMGPAAEGLFGGSVQGFEVKLSQLVHVLDRLRKMPLKRRSEVRGLPADRADIIVAGLTLAHRLMKTLGAASVRVHEGGIRDGLLLEMAAQLRESPAAEETGAAPDPMRSVRRFARTCGYEQPHSRHVARLALRIFDQLAQQKGPDGFGERERVLLDAAALLHDVGYLINYSGHHKHSYHLIVHADLPGLSRREVGVIANVARYHRLAEPTRQHAGFARLAAKDRRLVRRLAAILRVADGLDRTHSQSVSDVQVIAENGKARFLIFADQEPAVDIWGAQRKSGLFEEVFEAEPALEFHSTAPKPAVPPAADAASQPAPAW